MVSIPENRGSIKENYYGSEERRSAFPTGLLANAAARIWLWEGWSWVLLRSTQPTNCGIYYRKSRSVDRSYKAPMLMLWIWQSRPSRQGGAARRGKCRNRVLRKKLGFSANGSTTN